MATSDSAPDSVIDIPAEHYEVARQYVVAIVGRDRRAAFDSRYCQRLTASLWNRFFAEYVQVSSGPYARRGRDAVRIALSRM